jgi:hypothetical protein
VSTAYVVAFIDTNQSPPTVACVGILSDRNPTTQGSIITLLLTEFDGDDYQDAHDSAVEYLNAMKPWHPWAKLIANTEFLRDEKPKFVLDREGEMAALQRRMVELDAEMGAPQGKQAPGQGA